MQEEVGSLERGLENLLRRLPVRKNRPAVDAWTTRRYLDRGAMGSTFLLEGSLVTKS